MRSLLGFLIAALWLGQALARCENEPLEFAPASGKSGYRLQILVQPPLPPVEALIFRPFHAQPERYRIVFHEPMADATFYLLVGPAGVLKLASRADGSAVLTANRDVPARWRQICG